MYKLGSSPESGILLKLIFMTAMTIKNKDKKPQVYELKDSKLSKRKAMATLCSDISLAISIEKHCQNRAFLL